MTIAQKELAEEITDIGGAYPAATFPADAIGSTMFDAPGSEDGTITVLLPRDNVQKAPAQAMVRIKSRGDNRNYLGVVSAGPFAQPDTMRADSAVMVAIGTRGGDYLPSFHGRIHVTLLGQELDDGTLTPPRLRPLPHSPVFQLNENETAKALKAEGDIAVGLAVGHEKLTVAIPSAAKSVLPRHTAILGTTGSGKTTTVSGLVQQAQAAGVAVVLLDVEGEYTRLNEPTTDPRMVSTLAANGKTPAGLPADSMHLLHLVGRDTTNPKHPCLRPFSLQFARLSPYVVIEMLGMNEAQSDRYLFAYDVTKTMMRRLGIFPQTKEKVGDAEADKQERIFNRLDEFERGYPRMTLSFLLDVVGKCRAAVGKGEEFTCFNKEFKTPEAERMFQELIKSKEMPGVASSWGKVNSLLRRLNRLKVFDRQHSDKGVKFLNYADLLTPGRVSVIDLSDSGMSELNNIAVADVLRGIQEAQEKAYTAFEKETRPEPPRVLIIVEEAHEFLSAERIEKTPNLFNQVARIAKRGRKRWLGLAFVTQLPQHLPRQVLGLCNNFILHKLTDPQVVSTLAKTVPGIDPGLWARLPALAPGQAVVSFGHMTRPLLTAMNPTTCQLRMVD
ncbi:ATP-binding protein [Zavarzinella formosa]|uniref:ATP-binding protein n=1 Tax=Zavarzinella formosa TaxID=360055 RepID=UPI0002E734C9|nr:ATP-binding protein [Zavarzinella formosa]